MPIRLRSAESSPVMTSTATSKKLYPFLAAAFWLLLWETAARMIGKELILPGPFRVLQAFLALLPTAAYWQSAGATMLRILFGYLLGIVLGILFSILTSVSQLLDALLSPLIRIIRATPVASFIILAMLWMGKERVPTLLSTLMVVPVVWGNLSEGVKALDPDLLEMARAFRFSRMKTFGSIIVPSLRPALRSAALTSIGLAWKSGIAAEVLAQPSKAIGSQLYYAKIYLETPELFAWTLSVIFFSILIEKLVRTFLKRQEGKA